MVWTFFVLDFDETYDVKGSSEFFYGITPMVYLIPEEKKEEVENCAMKARDDFHTDLSSDWGIGDYFEDNLKENKIDFKYVGEIKLTFKERKEEYLANYIPRMIV